MAHDNNCSVVQDLKKALECPCCYDEPRPNTTTVGMCNNGHMTCESCGRRILQTGPSCPVCRHTSFRIVAGHMLTVTVIQILTNLLVYNCRHNNCGAEVLGKDLVKHETSCPHKPVHCPKITCLYKGPIYRFMENMHTSCISICDMTENNDLWDFTINIQNVFSFDHNLARISSRFKTVILKGTTSDGFESNAYINIKARPDAIMIYAGWLNMRGHVEEKYQNAKIDIYAYANTLTGRVGQFVTRFPKFDGELVEQDDDGVFLARHTLYKWAEWSCQFECHECPRRKRKAHMHIQVAINSTN